MASVENDGQGAFPPLFSEAARNGRRMEEEEQEEEAMTVQKHLSPRYSERRGERGKNSLSF